MRRASWTISRRNDTTSRSPRLPTTAPCVCTYRGRASSRAGVSRLTWSSRAGAAPVNNALVSSGRQMGASEQRGHLGLASSGGGRTPALAMSRICPNNSRVRAISVSSNGMVTRRRDCAK